MNPDFTNFPSIHWINKTAPVNNPPRIHFFEQAALFGLCSTVFESRQPLIKHLFLLQKTSLKLR